MTQYITATYRHGQLHLDSPIDLPEGQKVHLAMVPDPQTLQPLDLRPEEAGWDDPAAIQARIERLNSIEPWEMTPEEEQDWLGFREQIKQYTLNAMHKQADFGQ